jgi:hypothetical protein
MLIEERMPISRRAMIRLLPAAALGSTRIARADATRVEEKDDDAQAQHYVADAARVDKAEFPRYATGQTCANCNLFDGSTGAATGGCSLFLGKEVAAKGWCEAWEKKS